MLESLEFLLIAEGVVYDAVGEEGTSESPGQLHRASHPCPIPAELCNESRAGCPQDTRTYCNIGV